MTLRDPPLLIADAWHNGHLIGPFELRGAVSRGASGIVYRAWDHGLGIAVAINEHLPTSTARRLANGDVVPAPPTAGMAYDSSLQAFIEGTRALARCDHRALVRVLHLHTGHGTAYRVMPWVVGDRLREARHGMSRPPDELALRAFLDDLLGALEAVHRTGNVHGGVRPSNILLQRGDRPLLLGPCTVAEDAGVAPGPWSDLRALADVARFFVSGMSPTADGSPVEPTAKVVERLLFDDRAVRYGREFMRVLDVAASPDVALRPQSVAEFREQLRQAARVDAGPSTVDRRAPAGAGQADGGEAAGDTGAASLVQQVIDAIPPRAPAELRPLRRGPKSVPIKPPLRPASEPFIDETDLPPMHLTAPPRRRARVGARVFAVLLAVIGFGAWQWLYRPVPTDFAPVASQGVTPVPAVLPSLVPAIPAARPEAVAPVIEVVEPAAANQAARPVEPKSAAVDPAAIQPAPARSPREACGERTQFALYYCMQQQCELSVWTNHRQCVQFRATDRVE